MKILDELKTICNVNQLPLEHMVITYSPQEGLTSWWFKSNIGNGFKYPEFVIETLEMDKKGAWWTKKAFDDMDWNCNYVFDQDEVDLGPYPFVKKAPDFLLYYKDLYEAQEMESQRTVNIVGVDYERIKNRPVHPKTKWHPVSLEQVITRKADPKQSYEKLRGIVFDGWPNYMDMQRDVLDRIVANKDEFIRLLRNL